MDKHLHTCLDVISQPIERAVADHRLSGAPFVRFANDAAMIFAGFETIAELLEIDLLREGTDGEEGRMMTGRQKGALLGMINATSRVMSCEVGNIVAWADRHLEEADRGRRL